MAGGSSRISLSVINKTKEIEDLINGIDYSILDEFVRVMKKVNIFIWCSKSQMLDLMSNIVGELHELGKTDKWIMKHLGMDADEVLRLKQLSGLASLFKDKDFSKGWE